jgi:hypothetical protein
MNMSAEIELQAGQWYRRRDGEIVYCFAKNPVNVIHPYHLCCEDGTFETCTEDGDFCVETDDDDEDIIEHLPDCTGFDWVPPKPVVAPEGWRLLTEGEIIEQGDIAMDEEGCWLHDNPVVPEDGIFRQPWNIKHHYAVLRKIEPPQPKYRAFKDGVEFAPYRDEWFCDLNNLQFRTKVTAYDHRYVWFAGANVGESYLDAFKTRLREDGSEFGVLDNGT